MLILNYTSHRLVLMLVFKFLPKATFSCDSIAYSHTKPKGFRGHAQMPNILVKKYPLFTISTPYGNVATMGGVV